MKLQQSILSNTFSFSFSFLIFLYFYIFIYLLILFLILFFGYHGIDFVSEGITRLLRIPKEHARVGLEEHRVCHVSIPKEINK